MKIFLYFFLLFCFSLQGQERLIIKNVNLLSPKSQTFIPSQTIYIQAGKITRIATKPGDTKGYQVIDGQGKYLIPGLMDMHAHFFYEQGDHRNTNEKELKTMLANGLTSARIMAGHPSYLEAREKIKTGSWTGPNLFIASPQMVGRWPWSPKFENFGIANTPEEAKAKVRQFKKDGYDEIKITFMVKKEVYDAIFEAGREVGIKVTGHVGPMVKLPAALKQKGQNEHMDEFIDMLLPDTSYNHGESVSDMNLWRQNAWATVPHLQEEKIPALAKMVKEAGIYVTPTNYFFLSCFGKEQTEDLIKNKPDYSYIPPQLLAERWQIRQRRLDMNVAESSLEKYRGLRHKMVNALWKAGVPLMAGSDSPEWFLVTGFSIHDEIESFVTSGLTPEAALQTATINPATYMGIGKSKGKIEKSYDADLILLDANPLEDIRNTRSINAVIKNGVLYDRATLDGFLREGRYQ